VGIVCLHCCAGQPLPADSDVWLPSAVRELHLSRSAVTADGVAQLTALPTLTFLDVRGTGVPRVRGLRSCSFGASAVESKQVLSGSPCPRMLTFLLLHWSRLVLRCCWPHNATRENPHAPLIACQYGETR